MGISLAKGQRVSLEKVSPGLKNIFIGLGWDLKTTDTGSDFDLDGSAFLLGSNDKLVSEAHFVFYNNLQSPDPDKAVRVKGDNRTGSGEGDDEVIEVDLTKVPNEVVKIAIAVTIHQAAERKQNFGQVANAFVRIVNVENQEEIIRYDLTEDYSIETALVMAELYRKDGEWRMNALGSGYKSGLQALFDLYK
ncbi:putative stress response protein, TerZ- and CABP1 [Xenococcus sp. PCC 7305]|uniref:TerD family protein n=1 Tax=Xenococcus sp. PCC 7305 TaxID=102125 RepID=UPI0002AC2D78|nr:TerD family protein [Xenococcus sp. PCC 7305]ELS01991.1 putative stress response protein, TerZ- and CABP1 [Xenococcus sp. PCC 7305]